MAARRAPPRQPGRARPPIQSVLHLPLMDQVVALGCNLAALQTCRAMRDAARSPPCRTPAPLARALVSHWVARGSPESALVRACRFPVRSAAAWLRIGASDPSAMSCEARDGMLTALVAGTLGELDAAGATAAAASAAEEALSLLAGYGRAGPLRVLLQWHRVAAGPERALEAWQGRSRERIMLLYRAASSGSSAAMSVLIDDIVSNLGLGRPAPGSGGEGAVAAAINVAAVDVIGRVAAGEGLDDLDLRVQLVLNRPQDQPPMDALVERDRTNTMVYMVSHALFGGAVFDGRLLEATVQKVRGAVTPIIVDLCVMNAVDMALIRASEATLSRLIAGGHVFVGLYSAVSVIVNGSAACMRAMLESPAAADAPVTPRFLRSALMHMAKAGEARRLAELLRYWERRGLAGRRDAVADGMRLLRAAEAAGRCRTQRGRGGEGVPGHGGALRECTALLAQQLRAMDGIRYWTRGAERMALE